MQARTSILLVEDEPLIAAEASRKLEQLGYAVSAIATEAEEAYMAASASHPDLVLMDINLEGAQSGIEAAAKIYEDLQIPVVFLTAQSDQEILKQAQDAQAFGYLTKPVACASLSSSIEIALLKSRKQNEQRVRELWLETQLCSVGEGLVSTSHDGTIRFINAEGERIIGLPRNVLLGAPFHTAVPLINSVTGRRAEDMVRLAFLQGGITDIGEDYVIRRATEDRRIEGNFSVAKVGNEPTGVVFTFRDVSVKGRSSIAPWNNALVDTSATAHISRTPVQLQQFLQVAEPKLKAKLAARGRLQVEASRPVSEIQGNEALLEQILEALLEHVLESSGREADIRIEAADLDFEKRSYNGLTERYVRLKFAYRYQGRDVPADRFADAGARSEMPVATRLARMHSAVDSLRGTARVFTSERWTCWEIDLPAAPAKVDSCDEISTSATIILVERNAAVRDLLCRYLTDSNYECLGAQDVQEARGWMDIFAGQTELIIVGEEHEDEAADELLNDSVTASVLLIRQPRGQAAGWKSSRREGRDIEEIDALASKEELRAKVDEMVQSRRLSLIPTC